MKKILLGILLCGLCVLSAGTAFAAMSIYEFLDVCRKGTPQQVEEAIKGGTNVFAKNVDGVTLLMVAAQSNPNPEVINVLIKAGLEVDTKEEYGNTALIYAARWNVNPEVINKLIGAGADANAKNKDGWTPLISAARWNVNPEVINRLIGAGADVNAKNEDDQTPLIAAAKWSANPKIISALIKAGANASAQDIIDKRAIDHAKDNKDILNTEAYRQLEAMPIAMSDKEFLDLCETGTPQQVEEAIKGGANVHAKGRRGETPIMIAAGLNPNPEVISALINAGANIHAQLDYNYYEGVTPLMIAAANPNPEVINKLIGAGADVNVKNKDGETALIWAAQHSKNPEVIITLINAGADVNVKNQYGRRAIDYAEENENIVGTDAYRQLEGAIVERPKMDDGFIELCKTGTPQQVEEAIKGGADVNAKYKNDETPLTLAAWFNPNLEIITMLIKAGADVNARAKSGWTVLMLAALQASNPEVIIALINAGADVHAKYKDGKRAIDYAKENKDIVNTEAYRKLEAASK